MRLDKESLPAGELQTTVARLSHTREINVRKTKLNSDRPNAWLFLGLALGLTWLFWIPAALLPLAEPALPVLLLHYLGGVMPTAVAIVLLYARRTAHERRAYWLRLVDLRRIGGKWVAVVLLAAPVITGLAALGDAALGGMGAVLEAAARFVERPLALLPFAAFTLLFGPLPEEMAWRGYALEQLQKRWNALTSSLILGAVWTVWHLPLFFIEGSYQHGLGVGTQRFWLYMLDKLPQSILMTWVYNNTDRSVLSAVLFHFGVNLVGEMFALAPRAELLTIVLWWLTAAAVTAIWGPLRLARGEGHAQARRHVTSQS